MREVEQAWLKLFAENLSGARGPRGQLDALPELHRLTINRQIWPLAAGVYFVSSGAPKRQKRFLDSIYRPSAILAATLPRGGSGFSVGWHGV
jgi:hypothetical protein